jgi:hypothetical protein
MKTNKMGASGYYFKFPQKRWMRTARAGVKGRLILK